MCPDCPSFVPGYGDANADFHVVGDYPGVHGGADEGIPFTGEPWSAAFFSALADAGLITRAAVHTSPVGADDDTGDDVKGMATARTSGRDPDGNDVENPDGNDVENDPIGVDRTFLSYLHMCVSDDEPTATAYDDMGRFFDAELRAIAAHVLLPVGTRATEHVLREYTARAWKTTVEMDELHGEELLGSGWLVVPIKDPADWNTGDADRLVEALRTLQSTDFRRESDLGRFVAGNDPYLVR